MDKNTKKYLSIVIILSLAYIIVDYLNIPTLLNIHIDNINTNLLDIFINSMIVITLYLITYLILDKRAIQISKNKVKLYKQILINMYKDCIDTINLFSQPKIFNNIINDLDFDAPMIENKKIHNFISLPFENKDILLDLAKNGEIDVETFQKFLTVQTEYRKYIETSIVLYDRVDELMPLKIDLLKLLEKNINELGEKDANL